MFLTIGEYYCYCCDFYIYMYRIIVITVVITTSMIGTSSACVTASIGICDRVFRPLYVFQPTGTGCLTAVARAWL